MESFCANPKCIFHGFEANVGDSSMRYVTNGVTRTVERFMHKDRAGERFALCSQCEEAVEFVKGAIEGFEEEDLLG